MCKLKLSELNSDVQIANEKYLTNYNAAELRDDIVKYGASHHNSENWYVAIPCKWKPDALDFLDYYIESVYQNMYEDWDERAWNCITDETINEIQKILDKTFDEATTDYWEFDFNKPVEIDVKPKDK